MYLLFVYTFPSKIEHFFPCHRWSSSTCTSLTCWMLNPSCSCRFGRWSTLYLYCSTLSVQYNGVGLLVSARRSVTKSIFRKGSGYRSTDCTSTLDKRNALLQPGAPSAFVGTGAVLWKLETNRNNDDRQGGISFWLQLLTSERHYWSELASCCISFVLLGRTLCCWYCIFAHTALNSIFSGCFFEHLQYNASTEPSYTNSIITAVTDWKCSDFMVRNDKNDDICEPP